MKHRLKVLVSVYACEPDKGSEPGVGWNWVKQIARFHDVWAITRTNNREPIEQAIAKDPVPNIHWVYFDFPGWLTFWKNGQRGVQLYYYLWQLGIYFVARRLMRQVAFELAHHLTFVKYWAPSLLALLPLTFIWGPIGGAESTPGVFYPTLSFRGKVYERVRQAARWLAEKDPLLKLTIKRARIAIATTQETKKRLEFLGCHEVVVCSALGIDSNDIQDLPNAHKARPFQMASIGRLLHWKGFHLGLKAFACFQRRYPDSEYHVIGDGPERRNLEHLALCTGVARKLRFWGYLPHNEVLEKLKDVDVLVHPSLHDSGGGVCIEAMAAGRPVICLNLGGPACQLSEETGFKIAAVTPEQVVRDISAAMLKLACNRSLRNEMSKAARDTILSHFTWDKKGEWIDQVYRRVYKAHRKKEESCPRCAEA